MKLKFFAFLIAALAATGIARAQYEPTYRLIENSKYDNEDLGVATFNVLDFGIKNDGSEDCTLEVQRLLDAAAGVGTVSNTRGNYQNITGGVVYFPEGEYLFKNQIVIPRGVTIRGDWKRPVVGQKIEGTIFKVDTKGVGTTATSYGFIIMQPSTLVTNIAFWYPNQDPAKIRKYPATIVYGQPGYWGNDYCNVRHCTFVNSYIAVQFHPSTGGGCPNVYDVYGTPLGEGIEMDCIADVGRFDGLHFSSRYWEGSGLPGSPSRGQIDQWLYDNAIGVVMRRNDWSYTCNLDVEGYNIGFHAQESPSTAETPGRPNGHNYGFNLQGCRSGIKISSASGSGIMFANVATPGCHYGVELVGGAEGPVQFYGCDLDGESLAIYMHDEASSALMFQDCNVIGKTAVGGGHFQSVNSKYHKNVEIEPKGRTIFTDNVFVDGAELKNGSIFECAVGSNPGMTYPKLPTYKAEELAIRTCRPQRAALYVFTDVKGATINEDPASLPDCSAALQALLDKAGAEGGGIVYLPGGHYRCNSPLTIPTGVELKGSGDIPTVPKGNGAILEVTCGEGNENGTPFISMEKGSGIRGISINYPAQNDPRAVKKFPYAVRGNADCYLVNLALRAAYRGLDLFTNKCDNHYVDYLAGHCFMNVVRIGGNSENGVFNNTQCNTIAYACGDESKFGCWPNSLAMAEDKGNLQQAGYGQNEEDLEFLIVGDCKNEVLYNNFLFGCNTGMLFQSDGNGGASGVRSLGNAVDGAVNTFVINEVAEDLNLVNSQIVALNHDKEDNIIKGPLSAYFITTGEKLDKTVNFFSSNNWGGGHYMTDIKGGTVNIAMTNMNASGAIHTIKVAPSAQLNIFNGRFNNVKRLVSTPGEDETRSAIVSTVIDNTGNIAKIDKFRMWENNLSSGWKFSQTDDMEPRTGWRATAFNDEAGSLTARYAIDGKASTRWSTNDKQTKGQWFAVDFGKNLTINAVILDAGTSGANDAPAAYNLEIWENNAWKKVATGKAGGDITIIPFEEATTRKFRVTLTAGKSNYWSIHECYVGKLQISGVDEILTGVADFSLAYTDRELRLLGTPDGPAAIDIYDLNGNRVLSALSDGTPVDLSTLSSGLYIAVARTASGATALKFLH